MTRVRSWFLALLFSASLWCLLMFCIAEARAEPLKGLDLLGLAKMDAKMVTEEIDNGTAIGVLFSAFGDPASKIGFLAASGKVPAIRVHLRDYTCYRASHCPTGTPSQSDTKPIRSGAAWLAQFTRAYPNTHCYVSPALEHDVADRRVVNSWYKILDEVIPNCVPVCSAYRGWCPDKTPGGRQILIEKHGNGARGDIISNDGNSIFDTNAKVWVKGGKVLSLAWDYSMNGRVKNETRFTPPLQRKVFTDRATLRKIVRNIR